MTPIQFQGRFSPKSIAKTLMLASTLALPGCAPKALVAPSAPAVEAGVAGKPVRIAESPALISNSNTVQVVWVKGQKFLWARGAKSAGLVPFCNPNRESDRQATGVIQDKEWVNLGKANKATILEVDGERFAVIAGYTRVSVVNLDAPCKPELSQEYK